MNQLLIFIAIVISAIIFFVLRKGKNGSTESKTQVEVTRKQKYTVQEVSAHSTPDDLWLIIKDKVYDFTDYIGLHPGGEAILRNAGGDSTEGFSGSQHPHRVWDMIEEFCIGDLEKAGSNVSDTAAGSLKAD